MTTTHTPAIALMHARAEYARAQEHCPHWDHEGHDSDTMHDCCYRLADARRQYRDARRAMKDRA